MKLHNVRLCRLNPSFPIKLGSDSLGRFGIKLSLSSDTAILSVSLCVLHLAHDARVLIFHIPNVLQAFIGSIKRDLVILEHKVNVSLLHHKLGHNDGQIFFEILFDLLSMLNRLLNRFARAVKVTHSHLELCAQE